MKSGRVKGSDHGGSLGSRNNRSINPLIHPLCFSNSLVHVVAVHQLLSIEDIVDMAIWRVTFYQIRCHSLRQGGGRYREY